MRHVVGVIYHPPVREPHNLVGPGLELRIAPTIEFKRGAGAMSLPAIGLDDQPMITPQEVDLVSSDLCIHLGLPQSMAYAQPQEASFEL